MRIKQALRIRDRGISMLCDCYSAAQSFGSLHADMNKRRLEGLERIGAYKAPHWVRSYLNGYWRALMDGAYRSDLVYGGIIGGRFYSVHRDRADYYEKNGIEPSAFATSGEANLTKGHYWAKSLKPFFVSPD